MFIEINLMFVNLVKHTCIFTMTIYIKKTNYFDYNYKEEGLMLDFTKFNECVVDSTYGSQFYEYRDKIYYCRKSMTYYELIISSIAKYFGIESVEYLTAKKDDDVYLISESFLHNGEIFKDGYELLEDYKKKHRIVDDSLLPGEKLNNLKDIENIT